MFEKVSTDAEFVRGEHDMLRFWESASIFDKLRAQNAGKKPWSFLDGPITANNPMGVHHAWGRTYKDAYQRFYAMTGRELRYQNGFDCQGLWVEVEVEKELNFLTKNSVVEHGLDKFVRACKQRVLTFAARQTEQSVRLGYWMDWDIPDELRKLAAGVGTEKPVTIKTPTGKTATGEAEELVGQLGNPKWGGSYFTFSTENNETIWTFLKKCHERGKIYRGYDVMPWSGRGGSAYSQMEVAEGRKLTTHKSVFVRFPLKGRENEYLLVWTTTPWTLTSNVAAAVNPQLEYVRLKAKRDGAIYYFAKENLEFQRLSKEFKEGFGRPEWNWPKGVAKLKTIAQIFKEQGGYEVEKTLIGAEMVGWEYTGPFDKFPAQECPGGFVGGEGNATPGGNRDVEYDAALELIRLNLQELCDPDNPERTVRSTYSQRLHELRDVDPEYAADEAFAARNQRDFTLTGIIQNTASSFRVHLSTLLSNVRNLGAFAIEIPATPSFDQLSFFLRNLGLEVVNSKDWKTLQEFEKFSNSIPENSLDLKKWPHTKQQLLEALNEIATETVASEWELRNGFLSDIAELQLSVLNQVLEETRSLSSRSAIKCHHVVDGGRDSEGKHNVTAGEGTGIVHIAPGCGDVDHVLGKQISIVAIAPLAEDGRFLEGFGPFTDKEAIDRDTAELVFEELKKNGLLVSVEEYPHIYPHCWRTGDELVFRLVDEWFIKMDWREEIMGVVKKIRWLPDSIDGQTREIEWLTNMRDWMISKKRFWGLALPIWVDEDESVKWDDPAKFEVIGSLEELKARAVEGWDDFSGHTPHRPWIDKVKIRSPKTGNLMVRIPDVGNPWLDAGIVPFSTLQYNTDRDAWKKWYPADLVTECFPGQFRNWFYSLLSMATMMDNSPPFKTLLGHRLVMNEEGKPMHKSDGTAIWFEEAAEQLGVDTMRWMYLAQNPAADLRFGKRNPDKPVTLRTPHGPISQTREGVTTCEVTSKPADEIRRQVLIPLWNTYAFFVNYARLDGFDPTTPAVPAAERPEIDRWILANLHALIDTARKEMADYNAAGFLKEATRFIDDLSNWYVRRNRRRFWRSRDAGDRDKLAAYQTLYSVLVTLTKLLAPAIPFMAERMYQNLVRGVAGSSSSKTVPESVHLCEYPTADTKLLDPQLSQRMALAQVVVNLGHGLREKSTQRVRQPLAELRFACANAGQRAALETLAPVIAEELNVKKITACEDLDDLVTYQYKPNLKTLGPRYGKSLGAIGKALLTADQKVLSPLRRGESITLAVGDEPFLLLPEDVLVSTQQAADWVAADEKGVQIALAITLTSELVREGMARDFVRHIQQLRKDGDLEIEDRIRVSYSTTNPDVQAALAEWNEYVRSETLADNLTAETSAPSETPEVAVGEVPMPIWIAKV